MAPKKGTKRTDSKAAVPAAKKPKADPMVAGVVEALEQAADLPEGCRKMLVACMPHCFGTPNDERHACQEDAVRMIGEVLQGVETTLQKAADDEGAKVTDIEASKTGLQAAVTEAETALAAAAEDVKSKTATLAEAAKAMQAAKASVKDAESAQRAGDASFQQAQQSKAALDKGIETDLRAILEGEGAPEQHYQALLPLLTDLGLDESLMSALPSSCKKAAADRGAFDSMVLEQLGARLKEQAASLAKTVEEGAPAAKERASVVEGARAEFDVAVEAQKKAADALEGARAGERAAADGVKAAAQRLAAFEPEYNQATKVRDEKAAAVENFRAYNVTCFEQLRNQASAKVAGGGA